MVRELKFEALIPGCTTKEFYQIACADGKAIKQFHLETSQDDTVTVSDWDSEGRSRQITFTLHIAIPASLKRFVGAEPIRILETQTITWLDSNTLKIENVPLVQVSMADKISTHAQLLLSTTSEGCQIDVTVTVSASVPWPLQSTVESLMADQAKKTVSEYIVFISKYVEDALEAMNNQQQQLEQTGAVMLQQESVTQQIEIATVAAAGQQQQQQIVATPGTPVKPAEAAAPAVVRVDARAVQQQQQLQQNIQPVLPAAVSDDVFYDAQEVLGGSDVLNLLLKELQQAQEARREANRLLLSMKESLQQMERTISKEVAFQEGVRYGQRMGGGTLMLSMAAAAAAASAATAFILMRRSSK